MDREHINCFAEAGKSVIKQMMGIEAVSGQIHKESQTYKNDSVVVIVGITGKMRGNAFLVTSKKEVLNIASKIMGGIEVKELDNISRSAVSELANMIMGNTAMLLYNRGISTEITPPSFLTGDNIEVYSDKLDSVCVEYDLGDIGKMELGIAVEQ
jgi:chemotaxis protein CheX